MNEDDNRDLMRLFDEAADPPDDEAFVGQVSHRIRQLKRFQLVTRVLILLAGTATLILLKPWVILFANTIAAGPSMMTDGTMKALSSPMSWIVGGALGLPFFLRTVLGRSGL